MNKKCLLFKKITFSKCFFHSPCFFSNIPSPQVTPLWPSAVSLLANTAGLTLFFYFFLQISDTCFSFHFLCQCLTVSHIQIYLHSLWLVQSVLCSVSAGQETGNDRMCSSVCQQSFVRDSVRRKDVAVATDILHYFHWSTQLSVCQSFSLTLEHNDSTTVFFFSSLFRCITLHHIKPGKKRSVPI